MTSKQTKAIEISVKNSVPVKQAMLQAGYSPATANNPSNLTKSKGYQTAMAKILKKHGVTLDKYMRNVGEAMDATITIYDDKTKKRKTIANHQVRLAGNKQAERHLFGSQEQNQGLSEADIQALANTSDEIELTRLLFKKA